MKKTVKYALGAAGLAPAVGLMIPAAGAAAATVHPPTGAAKTVSLRHLGRAAGERLTCHSRSVTPAHTSHYGLRLQIGHSYSCIAQAVGYIGTGYDGLEMRTQVYSYKGGPRVFQNFVHGGQGILGSYTEFVAHPNAYGSYVCIALVESTHHSKIVNHWGPNCRSGLY